jgi:hypothetical protein
MHPSNWLMTGWSARYESSGAGAWWPEAGGVARQRSMRSSDAATPRKIRNHVAIVVSRAPSSAVEASAVSMIPAHALMPAATAASAPTTAATMMINKLRVLRNRSDRSWSRGSSGGPSRADTSSSPSPRPEERNGVPPAVAVSTPFLLSQNDCGDAPLMWGTLVRYLLSRTTPGSAGDSNVENASGYGTCCTFTIYRQRTAGPADRTPA